MVRDDGELEPELSIESTASGSAPSPEGETAEPAAPPRGTLVRDRLLERAARVEQKSETRERGLGDDLDEIGKLGERAPLGNDAPGPPRAPGSPLTPQRASLSPTIVALFGTLMGMAVIASITAIAMHVAPHREAASDQAGTPAETSATLAQAPARQNAVKKRERQRLPGPWRVSEGAHSPDLRYIEGKVGTDAFLKAVQAAGVPVKETYRIVTAFQGLKSFDHCAKTDRFAALVDTKTERLKAFEYQVSGEEVYQARESASGLLEASKLDLKIEHTQIAGALVYDGKSLDDSAEQAGFERGLARVLNKALDGHSAIEDLERGDVIRLIAQEVSVLGEFDHYAGVEALEVRRAKGEALRVYYFDAPGARGYYDSNGHAPNPGGWRKPIPGAPITSHFNLKRMHPILHKVMPHLGTDFGAPTGTPIGASAPGIVTFAGFRGPTGNLVKLQHAGGIETGYAHCSRIADGLKVGDQVKRMQIIGYVGSTGRSTGPHLHFSASKNGEFFDAEKLDLDGMRTLAGADRLTFDGVMAKYNPLLDGIALPEPLPPEAPDTVAAPAASEAASAPNGASAPSATSAKGASAAEPEPDEDDSAAPPPPLAAPPPPGSPKRAGSSIYLSDKELRELQGATDDGEVN
ncbi:MAG TPA: M23 family metallopeptidase [Polyangiaceae bacterium]|nr:M23 family metallopeptidase [Polyangiaceae bacterium]